MATENMRPQDKAQLLNRIGQSWTELEQMVDGVDEYRLTAPVTEGNWTVKDHLVHVSTWESRLLAFLEGRTLLDYFGADGSAAYQARGIDGLNDLVANQNRARSLADVLATWHSVHQQVLAALQRMRDSDLTAPFPDPDDPSKREPLLGSGLLDGNTYEHYEEHAVTIRALLD